MEPLPHEETTQTIRGEKGQRLTVSHRVFCHFKIEQIEATDTFNGRATKIRGIFIGADTHYLDLSADGGLLSINSKQLGAFAPAPALIDINFSVEFLEDVEWKVRLIGRALKESGDTREMLREKAVRTYEQDVLAHNPSAVDDPRFREMIDNMLKVP